MRNYIDISNNKETSMFKRLYKSGFKYYKKCGIEYLEYKGESILKPPIHNCVNTVKKHFNIEI